MGKLRYQVIAGFATIYVIWGSTYLAIRLGVETMPPFFMAGVRFLLGGLLLYTWARMRGIDPPRLSHWRPALILGLLMPAGGTGLVTWAETVVPSGLAALLVATVPMWMVLIDWLRPNGVRPLALVVLGLLLGFAGVLLLINPTNIGGFEEVDKFGAGVIVIAAISWAAGSIYSRRAHQPRSKLMGTAMQMIMGSGGLLLVSVLVGEFASLDLTAVSLKSWSALGYLITAGSVAFAAYVWLLSVSTPARAATYAYVNPVIALILGSLLAAEELSLWALGCSAIVILAVAMIITARAPLPKASDIKVGFEHSHPVQCQPTVSETERTGCE